MNIEMIVQDSKSGITYDISELVLQTTWETSMIEQPGKLTFSYLDDEKVSISKGSPVSLKVDGKEVFFGYVFKNGRKKDDKRVSIIAYDQLRYLKNKSTYVVTNMTSSQLFAKQCTDFKLKHSIISPSSYITAPRIHDNKALYEMLQLSMDETLMNSGNWYIIRDNYGTLQFLNINALKTNIFIGDESLLIDYDYEGSIDDDTYNKVRLVKENKKTKKREVYEVFDSNSIKQWGVLQYFEKMDESANAAQIKARAEQILKLKNRETKTLKLTCLGDLGVFAGCGIVLGISELEKESIAINKYFMVTKCVHIFQNKLHTMQLEVQVSI